MPIGEDQRLLLSVAVDPNVFYPVLIAHSPQGAISALVDREGLFIARSAENAERLGTQSTRYVRQAIASGERAGIYQGVTWEGFRNHTAYAVSSTSGWSAHIAIDAGLIDAPRQYSFVSILVGALLAIMLAAISPSAAKPKRAWRKRKNSKPSASSRAASRTISTIF
jgi:hypothetical protein